MIIYDEGSSPLARGLPGRVNEFTDALGIIPARAGFMCRACNSQARHWDHPRSRGVYRDVQSSHAGVSGSSPLARGLLRGGRGISNHMSDHPRSRGVYETICGADCQRRGSSPLARGLPARPSGGLPSSGSSPLARGLRELLSRNAAFNRIIPARAGFTRTREPTPCAQWDHPRSRGVYYVCAEYVPAGEGSSPLARGLLTPAGRVGDRHGIIPARAGFTLVGDEAVT